MISLPENRLCGVMVCHDTTVMTYAAYLHIEQPVAAFREPDRSRRVASSASTEAARRMPRLVECPKPA